MTQQWQPSNEPQEFDDEERIDQLMPVSMALHDLGLPTSRVRKLNVIVHALTMQIEDGGDSPAVNRLLLEALREGVLHQVGQERAQAVFQALDQFAAQEEQRWEQVRAGTLALPAPSPFERVNRLMIRGDEHLGEDDRMAVDAWLQAWEVLKTLARPEMRTTNDLSVAYPELLGLLDDWLRGLNSALVEEMTADPSLCAAGLRYCDEVLAQFPDEDPRFLMDVAGTRAEALWGLGRGDEAEASLEALIQRFPDNPQPYITWADHYLYGEKLPDGQPDYARVEALLRRALQRPNLELRWTLFDHLIDLYDEWGKPEERSAAEQQRLAAWELALPKLPRIAKLPSTAAPIILPKLPRNAPCWCGSGVKYKKCHLAADEDAARQAQA